MAGATAADASPMTNTQISSVEKRLGGQPGRKQGEKDEHRPRNASVGIPPACQISDGHSKTDHKEDRGHGTRGQASALGGKRRDICVNGEQTTESHGAD